MTRITIALPTRLWRELCGAGDVGDQIRRIVARHLNGKNHKERKPS